MSVMSPLPCFKCGKELRNVTEDADNQPSEGTEFQTYGHYGSTFWDSFDGEELVLNICDDCLRAHAEQLGQRKRYLPVVTSGHVLVGKQWVDRPLVSYTGNRDDGNMKIDSEEIGDLPGVDWPANVDDLRETCIRLEETE